MTDTREQLYSTVRQNQCIRVRELVDPFVYSDGYQLLQIAVKDNHTEMIKILLDSGCRVNSKSPVERECDDSLHTPLHCAVENENKDVVQLLLSKGSATDVFDKSGETPLHCAVDRSLLKITEQLLRSGADVNCISRNSHQYTPLHCAAEIDDIAMTNLLLNNGAAVNAVAKEGFTPMHIATRENHFRIVERLLSHGADVNVRTADGCEPLHFAISNDNEDMIQLFLQNKAEINDLTNKKQSPICIAIEKRCYKAAGILINQGADVNIATVDGYTPLHYAARNDNENIIQLLLDKNAEVNALTNKNQTPLHIAIENGSYKAAFILLNHGSKIDSQDNGGKSILYLAVEKGNSEIVREILKLRPDIDNNSNKKAFKIAALYADSKIVQYLIEYGFTVGPEDVEDGVLLHYAVQMGYFEIVKDLLRLGANVSFSQKGCTPLHTAVKHDQVKIAALLIQHKEGKPTIFHNLVLTDMLLARAVNVLENTALVRIAINNVCKEMVEVLLENNVDIGATDMYGRTALHLTAQNENNEGLLQYEKLNIEARGDIAKLLLKNGADVNAKTKSGFTALHLACQRGFSYVVEALLEYKADVECLADGRTPLIISASKEDLSIIEILLRNGANINAKDRIYGRTALHYAAHGGHTDALTVLLKENPEVNSQDIEGQTPLHLAVSSNARETAKVLLKHGGVNIDNVDNEGQTALHIASKKGNDAIVELLLKFEADVNIMTKCNSSPLDVVPYISDEEDEYDDDDEYDYDYDYGDDFDYGSTKKILIKRLIVMKIGNLYLNKENKQSVQDLIDNYCVYENLRRNCREEVERMKNEQIQNTKLKLYDILSKDVGWLAKYAKNEDIVDILFSGCYDEDEFPIYFADFRRNMKKAVERNHLIQQGQRFLGDLLGFPYACADQILQFLSNVDIKSMIQAYEQSLK